MDRTSRLGDDELERLLLDVRAGRAAGRCAEELTEALRARQERPGAVAVWPCHVIGPRTDAHGRGRDRVALCATTHPYPLLDLSHEPGTVLPLGVTRVSYTAVVGDTRVKGAFSVCVGDVDPDRVLPPMREVICGDPAASWIAQLPGNLVLNAVDPPSLLRSLERSRRQGRRAQVELVSYGSGMVRALFAQRLRSREVSRSMLATEDEVIAAGMVRVAEMVELFAGPRRPAATWARALHTNCLRDMERALHQFDPVREDDRSLRADIERHREDARTPEEMREVLAREQTRRWLTNRHPGEAAEQIEARLADTPLRCRYTPTQVRRMMLEATPRVHSLDVSVSDEGSEATLGDLVAVHEDPELEVMAEATVDDLADRLVAGRPDLSRDTVRGWLDRVLEADSAGQRPAGSSGPLGQLRRELCEPFLGHGERWSRAADRTAARSRAAQALTRAGAFLPEEDISEAWDKALVGGQARLPLG